MAIKPKTVKLKTKKPGDKRGGSSTMLGRMEDITRRLAPAGKLKSSVLNPNDPRRKKAK